MTNSRRLQDSDLSGIVIELSKKWAIGVYGDHLTWSALEKQFGFTRQTLQGRPAIKAAYDYAKKSLSNGLKGAKSDNVELTMKVAELQAQIEFYIAREELWRKRWQVIAFNIRLKGENFSKFHNKPNTPLHFSNSVADKLIKPFEAPITSSGRV